jgi:hypothetical protein
MLVVLAEDDLSLAGAEDPEDADTRGCCIARERCKVPGGLQTKSRNDCISDLDEHSDPGWLLREDESGQDIWICTGVKRKSNRKRVCEVHRLEYGSDSRLRGKGNLLYWREFAWHGWTFRA